MYCTPEDVMKVLPRQQLIELTCDLSGRSVTQALPEQPDEAVVNEAIRYASEYADGFLRNRYQVPLTRVPTIIRDLVVNLTIERLYLRRPAKDLPESVKRLFSGSLKTLELIRDGRMTPGTLAEQTTLPEPGQTRVKSRPAVLGGPGGWLEKY
ncbi:TPA: gp436 family protein [Salmonella enterica subsp. enterica serovar Montevideo]